MALIKYCSNCGHPNKYTLGQSIKTCSSCGKNISSFSGTASSSNVKAKSRPTSAPRTVFPDPEDYSLYELPDLRQDEILEVETFPQQRGEKLNLYTDKSGKVVSSMSNGKANGDVGVGRIKSDASASTSKPNKRKKKVNKKVTIPEFLKKTGIDARSQSRNIGGEE